MRQLTGLAAAAIIGPAAPGWERAARLIGEGLMLIRGLVAPHASPLGLPPGGAGVVTLVTGVFGSAFLGVHLMRGASAAALIAWAIVHQTAHPWVSLGAGLVALVALRGCPMCWTVGLVETLSRGRRGSTAERAERACLH